LTVPWEFSLRKGRKKLEGGKTDNAAAPANEQFNNLLVTFQPLLLRSLGIRGGNKKKSCQLARDFSFDELCE